MKTEVGLCSAKQNVTFFAAGIAFTINFKLMCCRVSGAATNAKSSQLMLTGFKQK